MARPLIALLTDFGTRDHYVGVMKGVALGICPDATLVDITHDLAPQDVLGAAMELRSSYCFFPAGAIFLVVVDPGVGSSRRAIAAEAGGYRFVAPDNGVLSLVFDERPPGAVVELANAEYALPAISRTFEGRDRFAPAAGWLAAGIELAALGPPWTGVHRLALPKPRIAEDEIVGEVLRADRFGNLITNIDRGAYERLVPPVAASRVSARVHIGSRHTSIVSTYAESGPGGLCALFGSSDHLEIAVNGGSAERTLGAGRGAIVAVRRERAAEGERDTIPRL
jgi:S-adenosylmethionine hydrolase